MATKKADQPLTVEQRLKLLYELQTILSHVDEIKTVRGELPNEVKDLEDTIEGLNTRIENYNNEIADLNSRITVENGNIETAKQKIAKYKFQLENIRNNREYEILSKEVPVISVGNSLSHFTHTVPTLLFIEDNRIKFVVEGGAPSSWWYRKAYLENL